MGFIFEKQQPVLVFSVYIDFNFYSAGINLLRLVKAGKLSCSFEAFCRNGRNIHHIYRLASAYCCPCLQILIVGFFDKLIFKGDAVYSCLKCSMSAVIRPVCVYHLYFRHSRLPVLFSEIFLTYGNIINIHSKTSVCYELFETVLRKIVKACNGFNLCRNFIFCFECVRHIKRCLSCFDRIYNVGFNLLNFLCCKAAAS